MNSILLIWKDFKLIVSLKNFKIREKISRQIEQPPRWFLFSKASLGIRMKALLDNYPNNHGKVSQDLYNMDNTNQYKGKLFTKQALL